LSDPRARRGWRPASVEQRLRDIVAYGTSAIDTVRNLSYEEFRANPMRQKAVAFDFQCVSEAAARLIDLDPSIRDRHPDVPWANVRALANVTRHEYGRLDVDILWTTAVGGALRQLIDVAEKELGA